MPVLDEASYLLKRAATTQATISADKLAPAATPGGLKLPNGVTKPTAAPLADLLDLNSDAPATVASTTTTAPSDFLQDLLGIGGTNSTVSGIYSRFDFLFTCSFHTSFLSLTTNNQAF
jgi:AP-1 complex subunit gamma-1